MEPGTIQRIYLEEIKTHYTDKISQIDAHFSEVQW
jgi:hypothetical protein